MTQVQAAGRSEYVLKHGAMLAAIVSIMLMIGCEALLFGFSYPFFSLSMEERGYNALLIGINASIGNLGIFFVGPLLPRLIRSYGVHAVVFAMFSGSAACFALLLVDGSLAVWFVSRFVMGACFAALWTSTEYWLNGMAPESVRGRLIGLSGLVYGAFQFAGPLLVSSFGVAGATPILIAMAPLVLGAVLALVTAVPQSSAAEDIEAEHLPRGWVRMLGVAGGLLPLAFAAGAGETAMQSMLPLYGLAQKLSQSNSAGLVAVFSAGEASLVFLLGWLSDCIGRMRTIRLTMLAAIVVLLALSITPAASALGLLLLFVAGGAVSGLYTLAVILAGKEFTGEDLVVTGTMLAMSYSLGSILGTVPMGLLFDHLGPNALPLGIAAMFALLFAALTLTRPYRQVAAG